MIQLNQLLDDNNNVVFGKDFTLEEKGSVLFTKASSLDSVVKNYHTTIDLLTSENDPEMTAAIYNHLYRKIVGVISITDFQNIVKSASLYCLSIINNPMSASSITQSDMVKISCKCYEGCLNGVGYKILSDDKIDNIYRNLIKRTGIVPPYTTNVLDVDEKIQIIIAIVGGSHLLPQIYESAFNDSGRISDMFDCLLYDTDIQKLNTDELFSMKNKNPLSFLTIK